MLNLWECEQLMAALGVVGAITFTGHLRVISERERVEAELKASRARLAVGADRARRQIQGDPHDPPQQRLLSATMNLRSARAPSRTREKQRRCLTNSPTAGSRSKMASEPARPVRVFTGSEESQCSI
jgi:hypothetical protein